jgi:hypothetical protein
MDISHGGPWHLFTEFGVGILPNLQADPQDYVRRRTGGGYLVFRPLAGYDVTPHFYIRGGGEAQVFHYETVDGNFHGVLELGTRIERFEVGVRAFVGMDGILAQGTSSAGPETRYEWTVAQGAQAVLRYAIQ